MKRNKLHRIGSYKKNQNSNSSLNSFSFYWYLKAEEFKRASDVSYVQICLDQHQLEHKMQTKTIDYTKRMDPFLWPTYILLISFALENLFKGLLLHNQPNLIEGNILAGRHFKSHDLISLATDCNFKLNEDEKRLCDIGSEFIKGFGRYPMTKNSKDEIYSFHINVTNTKESFESLYERLAAYMEYVGALTKPGGKQGSR